MRIPNWSLDGKLGGVKARIKGGSSGKKGGFYLRIFRRDGEDELEVLSIQGNAEGDELVLEVSPEEGEWEFSDDSSPWDGFEIRTASKEE